MLEPGSTAVVFCILRVSCGKVIRTSRSQHNFDLYNIYVDIRTTAKYLVKLSNSILITHLICYCFFAEYLTLTLNNYQFQLKNEKPPHISQVAQENLKRKTN